MSAQKSFLIYSVIDLLSCDDFWCLHLYLQALDGECFDIWHNFGKSENYLKYFQKYRQFIEFFFKSINNQVDLQSWV